MKHGLHELLLTLLVIGSIGAVIGLIANAAAPALDWLEDRMKELDLFDWKPSSRSEASSKAVKSSPTSVAAAESVKSASAILRDQVFDCLKENGPLTDEEMQLRLNMNGSTQRPRRVELWEAGLIEQSGMTRPTRSGRSAVVWRVREEELIAAE